MAALDFFAGCLGGSAGIVVGYPLDTIKVHMQTQDYRSPKYKGSWHCFRAILAKESVVGLYRGMTSPMAGVALVNAVIFGVYGQTQKRITNPDSLTSHFIAGSVAGIAQSPICSPIELAKTRMQLQKSDGRFSGPLHYLKHTYKYEGYRGVFKGLNITILRETPSFGTYFLTYEAIMRSFENKRISTPHMLLAGGLAGTASWVFTYPLDVVKTRIQSNNNCYSGVIDCFRRSMRTEGYSCFYRGLNSAIIRAFPTNAVTFAVVTWTFRICGQEADQTSEKKTPETIKTVTNVSDMYEPLLGKWDSFPIDYPYSVIIRKFGYSMLSMTCIDDSVFSKPVGRQFDRRSELEVRHDIGEQVRDGKSDQVEDSSRGREDVCDESGEKKVEVLDVQTGIGECRVIEASGLLTSS